MKNKWKQAPWYGYVIVALLCVGIFLPNFAQYQVTSLADRLRTEMGLSQGQYGSIATAPTQTARLMTMSAAASPRVTAPVTIGRFVNRGCNLSYFKSMRLSRASAALRAPVIASVIQNITARDGAPSAASNAPI